MEAESTSRVVHVDRFDGGVLITFDDGKSAAYSASLLRAMFDKAQEIIESEENE